MPTGPLPNRTTPNRSSLEPQPFSTVIKELQPFKTAILGKRHHLYRIKNVYREESPAKCPLVDSILFGLVQFGLTLFGSIRFVWDRLVNRVLFSRQNEFSTDPVSVLKGKRCLGRFRVALLNASYPQGKCIFTDP